MRPAADREHPHDVDLQRDHRAGAKTDGEIETHALTDPEQGVAVRVLAKQFGDRNGTRVVHGLLPGRRHGEQASPSGAFDGGSPDG